MSKLQLAIVFCCLMLRIDAAGAQQALGEDEFLNKIMITVQQSPTMLAAGANLQRAKATADRILAGPYETRLSVSAGRHDANNDIGENQRYEEWSGGLSRTIRLPNKRRIDKDLAKLEVRIAELEYQNSFIDEQLLFVDLWSEWVKSESLWELSVDLAEDAGETMRLEQVKVDSGAGRKIVLNQLDTEAKIAVLDREKLAIETAMARSQLSSRYPDYDINETVIMPTIARGATHNLLPEDLDVPAAALVMLKVEQASLLALKASKDKVPDPTLGIEFTDEFDGAESSVMATISFPLGRQSRRASARESEYSREMIEMSAQVTEQSARQRYDFIRRSAQVSSELLESLNTATNLSAQTLSQMQKGYELGAITISDLLVARRAFRDSQSMLSERRVDAISSWMKLLVITRTADSIEL